MPNKSKPRQSGIITPGTRDRAAGHPTKEERERYLAYQEGMTEKQRAIRGATMAAMARFLQAETAVDEVPLLAQIPEDLPGLVEVWFTTFGWIRTRLYLRGPWSCKAEERLRRVSSDLAKIAESHQMDSSPLFQLTGNLSDATPDVLWNNAWAFVKRLQARTNRRGPLAPPAPSSFSPDGYIGAKTICGGKPYEKNGLPIPRNTLAKWAEADREIPEKDPASGECWYRIAWVDGRFAKWRPRPRKRIR